MSSAPSVRADDAPVPQVWVVTDRHHPVHVPANARLIELDAPELLQAELSASLPNDPVQAEVIMRQRLASRRAELRARMATAYQGVIDAWTLGVAKAPAVVVDRTYVIYGERNVGRAVAKIESHRSKHQ